MTQLLVSVRSESEAVDALAGGAGLIDIKEPAHGSLGRPAEETMTRVITAIAGRRPISSALGELLEGPPLATLPPALTQLAYVKWGLAGYASHGERWQRDLTGAARLLANLSPGCQVVAVAYADWQQAEAPPPLEVCALALNHSLGAFLLDTWRKDGSTLLDWMNRSEVGRLCERRRAAGVPIALAGSLGPSEIEALQPARPDWFAVRGAACRGKDRTATVDPEKVRQLVSLVTR